MPSCGQMSTTEVPLHTTRPSWRVSSVSLYWSSGSLMYSTVPSSTRLSSGSNPFRMPLACRNHREEKQRGVREVAVLGPVQSGYPTCRCGGQPLQGRERRDTGSGVRVRAGSRPGARRSSPTPPTERGGKRLRKGLRGQFQQCGPVVWACGLQSNRPLGLPGRSSPGTRRRSGVAAPRGDSPYGYRNV